MQSSKEERARPWGRQTCIACTSMCEHQRHLRTWSKVWTAAKNYMNGKENELSTLNKMRSQYTPVLFPDNMDLSIFNDIRTGEFAGACSSLLVCWASCRSSHPTSLFRQCPLFQPFHWQGLQTSAGLLTAAALTCRMSPFFLMDPSTFASHLWGQIVSQEHP